MADRVDVIVLGMGVGGEEVAESLAQQGLKVLGIEHHLVGGELGEAVRKLSPDIHTPIR